MNAPEKTAKPIPQRSELTCIVRVNEEIKSIVATAFRINLMALNAIFLAKRAGNAALGFGVLSNELRRFAQDLTRHMAPARHDLGLGGQRHRRRPAAAQLADPVARRSASAATGCPACGRPASAVPAPAGQQARLRALDLRLRAVGNPATGRTGRRAGPLGQDRGRLRRRVQPGADAGFDGFCRGDRPDQAVPSKCSARNASLRTRNP